MAVRGPELATWTCVQVCEHQAELSGFLSTTAGGDVLHTQVVTPGMDPSLGADVKEKNPPQSPKPSSPKHPQTPAVLNHPGLRLLFPLIFLQEVPEEDVCLQPSQV